MLVHQHNEAFPYKTGAVLQIKRAFDSMLEKFSKTDGTPF
jgi:hypothetical protein